MKYNKLVRDKIPKIIKESGKSPIIHVANEEEYWKKLKEKLTEEVNEFLNESNDDELSDVLEVIDAICKFKKFNKKRIDEIKKQKAEKRGGFDNKIILDEVND
jgi:predicted house-cleaning noncanonical NTP pyrophosphatase (MazG superfamily)